jgi:hypothetical protein
MPSEHGKGGFVNLTKRRCLNAGALKSKFYRPDTRKDPHRPHYPSTPSAFSLMKEVLR